MKVFLSLRGVFLMSHTQQNIPNCLAKIKSHVEGIYEVVEANRSCPDVIRLFLVKRLPFTLGEGERISAVSQRGSQNCRDFTLKPKN